MGSYVFRWPYPAKDVHVTGTFDDWGRTEQLVQVGDIWEKEVHLPSADEKILYKFVVDDDQWVVDDAAPKEDDGHHNVNNVLYPEHIKRREAANDVPGAFPETPAAEQQFSVNPIPASSGISNPISLAPGEKIPDQKELTSNTVSSTVTTSQEDYERAGQEPEPTFSVNPIPASAGISNPITLTPGEKIPPTESFNRSAVDSAVTTSKEDYENAGKEADPTFSVAPIPASSGISNPISLAPGEKIPPTGDFNRNTIDSAVTTSKEDFEKAGQEPDATFSVNPIPASSGISNPITLAPGEKIPATTDFNPNTVESSVTTSKEDYEKSGSFGFPGAAAAGVAAAGAGIAGLTAASAFSKPEGKEKLIPESSLPMDAPKMDTLDAGPFISSAAPGSTTADLAAKVPLEERRDVSPLISSAAPSSTTADLAAKVPLENTQPSPFVSSIAPDSSTVGLAAGTPLEQKPVDATISSASPESTTAALAAGVPLEQKRQGMIIDPAVAPPAMIGEKADVEKELLSKVKASEATGEPASAAAQQTSYHGLATSVPKTVEESMAKADAPPEAAADRSVVAEKTAVEQELLSKIPSTNEAGEPAPTVTAATSLTAPMASTSTNATATKLTDGMTANETMPDTDTSTTAHGVSAGEVAGGAAVGGATAAGLATVAAKHQDPNVEPPRVADAQKPAITTEATPAAVTDKVDPSTAESSLEHEPAVRMMHENEHSGTVAQPQASTTDGAADAAAIASGVPTVTNAGAAKAVHPAMTESSTSAATPSAPSTPAKKTVADSSATSTPTSTPATDKKKKRHRVSAFIDKLKHKFD